VAQAVVDIKAVVKGLRDVEKLEKEMKDLERRLESLQPDLKKNAAATKASGKAAATASGNIQRFGVAIRSTIAPMVAGVALTTALSRSLKTLAERETDALILTRSLQNIGEGTDTLRELQQLSDELDLATLFNSEDFNKGFALLTSFKAIGVDSYERVTKAATDLATITRTDLSSAQLQLAKALENPVEGMTALSRSGTTFTKTQKEFVKAMVESNQTLEAQNYILSIVEGQYRGAAQAAAGGYAGALDTLSKRYRDVNEQLGKIVQPAATAFLNGLAGYLDVVGQELVKTAKALSILSGWIQDAIGKVASLGEQFRVAAGKVYLYFQRLSELVGLRSQFDAFGAKIAGELDGITDAALRGIPIIGQYITMLHALRALRGGINSTEMPGTDVDSNPLQGADLDMGAIKDQQRWADMMKQFQLDSNKITKTGGGGGAKGPDRVKMGTEMLEQQRRRLELLYAENDLEKKLLQIENDRADALAKVADIAPGMQDQATTNINEIFDAEKGLAIGEALARDIENTMALKEAREDALKPLEDQRALLEAKLAGNEESVRLQQQARDIAADIVGLDESEVLGILQQNQALEQQVQAMQKLEEAYQQIADSIAGAMTDAFRSVIDGSKSAEEAFADMLQSMGKALLDYATKAIAQYIALGIARAFAGLGGASGGSSPLGMFNAAPEGFNNIGPMTRLPMMGYANGGAPPVGVPSIVGERGPELFIPNAGGRVVSNEAMGNYMPNSGGGSSQGGPVTVNYTGPTLSFNQEDYVPMSAVGGIINQAAEKGATLGEVKTMNSLRNNRTSRARVGLR
jgi:uncharacterized protein YukE